MAKKSLFDCLEEKAPEEPEFTCPTIDGIKDELEKVREMNRELREGLIYWRETCEELCKRIPAAKRKAILKALAQG